MAQNKRRKKAPLQQCSKKEYFRKVFQAADSMQLDVDDFTSEEKQLLYHTRPKLHQVVNPDKTISPTKLNRFKILIRELNNKIRTAEGISFKTIDFIYVYAFMNAKVIYLVNQYPDDQKANKRLYEEQCEMLNDFYMCYATDIFCTIIRYSNPTKAYYSAHVEENYTNQYNQSLELTPKICAVPIRKKKYKIKGQIRTIYQMGKMYGNNQFEWISVNYRNPDLNISSVAPKLNLYIQTHAIKRMSERLDITDEQSINFFLWKNTCDNFEIIKHKNTLLAPVKIYDIKIGYFVVEPIDDMLIIKTFLFITHNCTPEGDKLKGLTGLGKNDISYWKIDRLSTFVNLDEEKYPKLMQLFTDAGMQDLAQLKNKYFDIESIQDANLDSLREYLKNSHQYKNAKEEDVVIHA
ncbi:hypothetical protein [Carboxylicivirga marina]|uniref:Initiator Rep protein domain-containing protein n=1 Tax=Carboxylicivirga marina TaxID=2800988 RepID=A0ABS1HPC8_9BACT|nr:hypothetical protein [Carboxylicivirga marina]MBK3519543.1 hypothetical protein [Carboxylicivirga marina]